MPHLRRQSSLPESAENPVLMVPDGWKIRQGFLQKAASEKRGPDDKEENIRPMSLQTTYAEKDAGGHLPDHVKDPPPGTGRGVMCKRGNKAAALEGQSQVLGICQFSRSLSEMMGN